MSLSTTFTHKTMRRAVAGLAAVGLAATLAACSGGGPAASSDGKGVLTFFSWDNEQTMKPLITEFEKDNPGISINFSYAPPVQQYIDTLSKRLLANQAADVFILGNKAEQAGAGYLKDLTDLPVMKDVANFNKKAASYDGKVYGLSVASWGGGVLVNKDLLAKAGITEKPATWDGFLADVKKLNDSGVTGYLEPSDGISTTLMAKIGQKDQKAGGLDAQIHNGSTTFSEAWTNPLDAWSELFTKGLVTSDVAGLKGDQVQNEFVAGRVGMIATGSWAVSTIRAAAPSINLDYWPIPGATAGEDFWAGAASPAYAINAKAKNPVAAEKWLAFVGSAKGVEIYHQTTGSITTTSNYKPKLDPSLGGIYDAVINGNIWCTWQAWPGASTSSLDATMLAQVQQVELGKGTAADITTALDTQFKSLK